ncbi:hypothetical protein FACHB389_22355 [Nostoc calcicola FACHB-389]|nr:hypothetical protein FACHB389_22355 [Nostoc calcicola FACHB-389]
MRFHKVINWGKDLYLSTLPQFYPRNAYWVKHLYLTFLPQFYPSSLPKLPKITPKISKGLFSKYFNAQ